jgi:hypothetical protein
MRITGASLTNKESQMKYSTTYLKMIWIGLFIGIGGLFYPHCAIAFSGPTLDPAQIEYIEINASVMIVNLDQAYVVIAEKQFDITEFKIGDEIYKTVVLDAGGNDISLKALKKGQYVIVKGIKLSKDKFIADSIQITAYGNKGLKKYQSIPKARSIKPLP